MSETLHISDIQLYNLLKTKLGDKEAEQLVRFVKEEIETASEKNINILVKTFPL